MKHKLSKLDYQQILGRIYRNPTMTPPQFIPASEFKPRFDTSTTAGKIEVMAEFDRNKVIYCKGIKYEQSLWHLQLNPVWDWDSFTYNFPAELKRTLIPWTKDTVPREAWVRQVGDSDTESRIISVDSKGFDTDVDRELYTNATSNYEHSLDNGRTWLPCGTWKEEV